MNIIDFNTIKKEKERDIDEIVVDEWKKIYILLVRGKFDLAINKLESILKNRRYINMSLGLKIRLYRNLSKAYGSIDNKIKMIYYSNKIKRLIEDNEKEIMDKYVESYVMGMSEYLENNKDIIDKREQIKINKKILKCARENNLKIDEIVADININFLKEDYEAILSSLRCIHSSNDIELEEIEENILEELKERNIEIYKKYKEELQITVANF